LHRSLSVTEYVMFMCASIWGALLSLAASHGEASIESFQKESCESCAWDENSLLQTSPTVKEIRQHLGSSSALPAKAREAPGFTKVMLADYPSTGSTWLRELLVAVSKAADAGNPSCDIYHEGKCELKGHADFQCDCDGLLSNQGAVLVKSHFPAQELFHGSSVTGSWQYDKTMEYDKLLQIVRHPVSSVMSNIRRWGGDVNYQSENLHGWGDWWEEAKATKGKDNLVLRYEDLCLNTTAKVYEVLQFLGAEFATISLEDVGNTLESNPELSSIYDEQDIHRSTAITPETQPIVDINEELMSKWGYRTDDISEWKDEASLPGRASATPKATRWLSGRASATPKGTRWLSARSPWKEIW